MIERYCRPKMKKIWSDENKFNKWLKVEIAICEAWHKLDKIPRTSLNKIQLAYCDHKLMKKELAMTHHDMTAFLASITPSVGADARFIHMGVTSSDIIDTALSLQLLEAAKLLSSDIKSLIETLAIKAIEHKYTLMIGRTHGIHAEPITFGLKLALWMEEMKRNRQRLDDATKGIAFGKISGPVGTYATVQPEIEELACTKLGLNPAPISNQVLQRDRHAQFMTSLAICAASLEKFATEIRLLQKSESREIEEPFQDGQTGSSSMPHKRNPELCERICGMARLIRAYALTSIENIALWHERDISHSSTERIILPDACLLIDYMLDIFTTIIANINVYPQNMQKGLETTHGLVFSQRVMLALIDKGVSRHEAYKLTQQIAMQSWENNKQYLALLKQDQDVMRLISEKELADIFKYDFYTTHIDEIFTRLGLTSSQWKVKISKKNTAKLAPKNV
ncbi:MAG: adenylosuccinate lyase [Dehalococcoidia bacterium]|nr:adenylosuccinate lyase [Dehalococcoidia bacterium]